MKKYLIMTLVCLFLGSSVYAMGRDNNHGNNGTHNGSNGTHPGGSGTPEPASLLLLLAGGAAAFITKKIIKK
ncbi:MAG: PEP-CTERM sorting domain-containing protein [Spirochaetota bacterium]